MDKIKWMRNKFASTPTSCRVCDAMVAGSRSAAYLLSRYAPQTRGLGEIHLAADKNYSECEASALRSIKERSQTPRLHVAGMPIGRSQR